MRADTQLDYAIFQLTPTRTRCELHIVAKGLTYKLASGLLKPFVSHLRAAEEQLAKGGYSIRLEAPDPSRTSWFTKGTMERFVRFVSTPEVLERVSSVEVELLELEETSRQQTSDSNEGGAPGQVDNTSSKTALPQSSPGGKSATTTSFEKPAKAFSDAVEIGSEESSKQRLRKALDARRMMLQKEQGMAFARALAAGFNLENMDDLVSFAECFGANRLREACIKFMALCKKRQEAGLGLEDLELMAAESVQADMLYMGALNGNAMGLVWPHSQGNGLDLPHSPSASNEGKQAASEDSTEKGPEELTRRASLDEVSKEQWQTGLPLRPANGDGEGSQGVVKGHPMMAAWQGQPHSQFMTGVPPYAAMHPSMPPSFGFTGPVQPGQMVPYPHYLGSPYMPPPYPDGNGWQAHSPIPPQYWPGNRTNDLTEGGYHRSPHQQNFSTNSAKEEEAQESSRYDGNDMHDYGEDELSADLSRRTARRSASPRRRSASPMRKVQIGRTGSSKRSGMVVIRNINYIAPKAKEQDTREDDNSEHSDSWSEEDESDEEETLKSSAETLRASIEDAVGVVEGKNRATKDGKRRHLKKDRKKSASKDAVHQRDTNSSALSAGENDAEHDDTELKQHAREQKDYVWMIGKRGNGADETANHLPEEGLFSVSGVRTQASFDPALENVCVEKKGGLDTKETQLAEDSVLLLQSNGNSRAPRSHSFELFGQEHQQESKKEPVVDDSYILAGGGLSAKANRSAIMEPDFDFNAKVISNSQESRKLPDDSIIVLDRAVERADTNGEWRMPLNLESEMPFDRNDDVSDVAHEPSSFEPDDLFMVPDRDQDSYRRAWNSPLDYDMQVLAADLMDNGYHGEDKEVEEDEPVLQEQQVEEKPMESQPALRKLSEKEAKAKAMKEMLERRKSGPGGRPGRPNPLAEAQLRAEKLRLYKAGLQKSKKEKDEEERKRIEDLRIQRQQRIAARSNPGGGNPSSPSSARATRTTPPATSKSSPKVPNKVSPLSPSLNRERLTNGSRVVRPALDSPKPMESPVTRSVSSVTELHKEAKKPTSMVRASTGSQPLSPSVRNERKAEPTASSKPNGLAKSRTDEKISRSDSGLADERVGRSESGRIEEKLGRTESRRTEGKGDHSENGHTSEKALPTTKRLAKRVAPQDVQAVHVKSPRGPAGDGKAGPKAASVPSNPAAPQKKTSSVPTIAIVEEAKAKPKALPASQKEEPKVEKSESPMKAIEVEEPRGVEVEEPHGVEAEKLSCYGNGNGHPEGVLSHSSTVAHANGFSEQASHGNGFSIPTARVILEDLKEESHVDSPSRFESFTALDSKQLEVEVSSSMGEECHASVADVSPSEGNHPLLTEAPVQASEGHFGGDYSPPFAPPTEYSISPTVNLAHVSPTSQQEFTTQLSPNDTPNTRSRKKWGDSKAKGLKRLLHLGRKSGRSSAQNAVDTTSEGDEEESPLSNGKHLNMNTDLDNFGDQGMGSVLSQADVGSANSSTKGSRSIFSLSTFRGKSSVKA